MFSAFSAEPDARLLLTHKNVDGDFHNALLCNVYFKVFCSPNKSSWQVLRSAYFLYFCFPGSALGSPYVIPCRESEREGRA